MYNLIKKVFVKISLILNGIYLKFHEWHIYIKRNRIIFSNLKRPASKSSVNINYWTPKDENENLGDYLSLVVCNHLTKNTKDISKIKYRHLYAIGSILGFGYQDAVVWGSGMLSPNNLYLNRIKKQNLDIRSVRGPKTREVLLSLGKKCPEKYGDPAILMPLIYNPDIKKEYDVSLVMHFKDKNIEIPENINVINILTKDYKHFIDEIKKSRLIISSSLHGIILAEAYGVPAIFLKGNQNIFKYEDWYFSTGRYDIRYAHTLSDAMEVEPMPLPNLEGLKQHLLNTFPYDLWN